jgi:hypothetical protein
VNELARWLFVPTLLLGTLGVVILICRIADAGEQEQAPQSDPTGTEQWRMDAEFAGIVATSLADLETKE